jgi:hypothetical protein
MASSTSNTLLKALGGAVLVMVLLSVVGTIVSIVMGVVATVVSLVLSLLVLGVVAWAVLGLVSFLGDDSTAATGRRGKPWDDAVTEGRGWRKHLPGGGDTTGTRRDDPADRLRERYVAGEIDEAEFERRMDRLLDRDSTDRTDGRNGTGRTRSRDRNWER